VPNAPKGRNYSPWAHFALRLSSVEREDPCPVDDPPTYPMWRRRFEARLGELLGPLPEPVPLNVETLDTVDCGTYLRHHVVYDSESIMSVPAYLLVPKARAEGSPGPAILAQHGHGPGKDLVCGMVDRELQEEDGNDYAHQLALRGYLVLAPDLRTFGERADWNPPDIYGCNLTSMHLAMFGQNLLAQDLWDLARGLDLLAEHPLVDPERIGMVGLSQGGTCTLFLSAWDVRVKAAVVSGYFNSWRDCGIIPWNMCGSQVLYGMLSGMDHLDLAGLIAPRPLLIESGTEDPIFPVAAARREHELLATLYQLLGAPDRLEHDVFDGGHRWHGDRAYPFLERWLGPVRDS
jgi:predicted esterase